MTATNLFIYFTVKPKMTMTLLRIKMKLPYNNICCFLTG